MREAEPKTKLGKLLKTSKTVKIIELVSVFLLASLFIWLFMQEKSENLILNQLVLWLANILMLSLVFAGIHLRGESVRDFGLNFGRMTWKTALKVFGQSLVVFIIAMAAFVIGSIIMANITGIPEPSDMSGYEYLRDNPFMLFLTLSGVYLVSSFGEEVVYRAFLINRIAELGLNDRKGRILVVFLSAVIFGLAHFGWGPMGMVQTGFMGVALGFSYLYLKRRLWALVLAHAYMDTILMVQLYMAS